MISENLKIYLSILNIKSINQLEEKDLDYWHQKRFIEIQRSSLGKESISKQLIELNNAKDYLDKYNINTLLNVFKVKEKKHYKSSDFSEKDSKKENKSNEAYYFMQDYGKKDFNLKKSRISENDRISRFFGIIFFTSFTLLIFGYYSNNEIALEKFIKSFEKFNFGGSLVFLFFIVICILGTFEFKKFIKREGINFFNLKK